MTGIGSLYSADFNVGIKVSIALFQKQSTFSAFPPKGFITTRPSGG
jgi:hypothetical protein